MTLVGRVGQYDARFQFQSRILAANPDQNFILMGDTSHVDPETQQDVLALFPGRIAAALVHKVNNVDPAGDVGLGTYDDYAQAAGVLFGMGRIDEAAARRAMVAAQSEGPAITNAEIDALIAANQP